MVRFQFHGYVCCAADRGSRSAGRGKRILRGGRICAGQRRETRLQQLIAAHRIGARTVQKLHQRLDEFIDAVQFGVTLSSLALGLDRRGRAWPMSWSRCSLACPYLIRIAHAVSVALAFILITYLHVVLGEVVPKSIALQRTERVALAVAGSHGRVS